MTTRVLKYLVLLAFALLIVAISSFWFSGPSFREGDVIFKLEGPTQISAGEEAAYKLKYSNETRSALHNLDLVFFYPEGSTVLVNGGVEEDYVEDFKIEELAPGEKGEKEFRAFLVGERGNIKIAKAVLTYKAGNLTSSFEKNVTLSTTIVSTPISLTLVAPPSAVSGGTIQYILDYRNESGEDVSDLILELDYPDGFRSQNFEPQPSSGNNSWSVKSLKKGVGGRISVTGVLSGNEGESQVVSAKLKLKVGGKYIDHQKVSVATVISNPALGLDITVNNSSDYSASLGDRLSYTVKYRNNSNIVFSGMNLVVKLEGDMFDLSNLDTRGGFFDDVTKTITWNTSAVPEFANLFPNTGGQINFYITVRSSFPTAVPGSSQDRFIKITAKFGTPNVPIGVDSSEVAVSSSLVIRVGTQPSFNQLAYYNDPDFSSFGPLPPRVGEETAFTFHWQLTNPGNDAENVKIVAKLSPNIQWANLVKAADGQAVPSFNPNTNEVTWDMGRLPYGTGIFTPKYEASFQLKARPSSTQVGNVIPLIESARFTGNDSFTKQSLIINKGSLSSDNLVDRPREGTVQ
ncbi:MAG: hypothetical protein Q8R55_01820 [Candidatus Taylorbacteria bacterium]|nr:hypothetical protein [Candidatus Taylorbacteria bacterium]